MPLEIIRQNIVRVKADAIVNSVASEPDIGFGVDFAIHTSAGPQLFLARKELGFIRPGEARATPAFELAAKVVIHTVGPVWRGGNENEFETLESCYQNALRLAAQHQCESIAFPLISTGTFGFPKEMALEIAARTIRRFLDEIDLLVFLVVYDKSAYKISDRLFPFVKVFLSDEEIPSPHRIERRSMSMPEVSSLVYKQIDEHVVERISQSRPGSRIRRPLHEQIRNLDTPFSVRLVQWIEIRGMTNVEAYKRANVDKKLFAKIYGNIHYQPKKTTALAFCVALKLSLEDTVDLIGRAGYCLTNASKADIIVSEFIAARKYDIDDINMVLFEYDQPTLGSR
jgi:O-acetyl-ADP-ribose deacetylase